MGRRCREGAALNQAIQHMMDLPADRVLKAARKLLADKTAR